MPCELSAWREIWYNLCWIKLLNISLVICLQSSKGLTPSYIASAGLAVTNKQQVVSVTDRVLGHQVWYNRERSRKPQTFTQVWRPGLYVNTSCS